MVIEMLKLARPAHASIKWEMIELVIRESGWEIAEGEELLGTAFHLYKRMVQLGYELDDAMAQSPGCALRLAAVHLRVNQLLEETIAELQAN